MRPDGFVSVDGGSLITRRLKFAGNELAINAIGPITVEVVSPADSAAKVLASATAGGDSLRHKVRFGNSHSLRETVTEGLAQLRFTIGEGRWACAR